VLYNLIKPIVAADGVSHGIVTDINQVPALFVFVTYCRVPPELYCDMPLPLSVSVLKYGINQVDPVELGIDVLLVPVKMKL